MKYYKTFFEINESEYEQTEFEWKVVVQNSNQQPNDINMILYHNRITPLMNQQGTEHIFQIV